MPSPVDWMQRVAAVAALLTALGTIGALWFTGRSLNYTAETTDATRRQVEVAEKGQVTDRYIRATEQLGSDRLGVRLGAIHSFARLMDDSKSDIPTIVEVLTTYVREHAPPARPGPTRPPLNCPGKTAKPTRAPADDVQAALTVIGRRPLDPGLPPVRINLTGVDLTGADLTRLHLDGAQLAGADLSAANLFDAHLDKAVLRNARLAHATLRQAHLRGADLSNADLSDANLEEADAPTAFFDQATMPRAVLSHAELGHAKFGQANLCSAHLAGAGLTATSFSAANLTDTYLVDARFDDTRIESADLTGAKGLTRAQLAKAGTDRRTRLPADLP